MPATATPTLPDVFLSARFDVLSPALQNQLLDLAVLEIERDRKPHRVYLENSYRVGWSFARIHMLRELRVHFRYMPSEVEKDIAQFWVRDLVTDLINPPRRVPAARPEPSYGKCTACGSIEVRLNRPTGTTSIEGESDRYPVGYGCELCD